MQALRGAAGAAAGAAGAAAGAAASGLATAAGMLMPPQRRTLEAALADDGEGRAPTVPEVWLVSTCIEWFRRAMDGGWVAIWVSMSLVDDCELRDYVPTHPFLVKGKEDILAYYNTLLSTHEGELSLTFKVLSTELVEQGQVLVKMLNVMDWGGPACYEMHCNWLLTLRGHRLERILMWSAEQPMPTTSCGITHWQGPVGALWGPQLLLPYRVSGAGRGQPSGCCPKQAAVEVEDELVIDHTMEMIRQWSSAISDTDWCVRWIMMCFTDDAVVVDHMPTPHSLVITGREQWIRYWRYLKDMSTNPTWSTRDVRFASNADGQRTLAAQCDCSWECEEHGSYRMPVVLDCTLLGSRVCRMEMRPKDLDATAGGRQNEDARPWNGEPLQPSQYRQYLVGGESVQVARPCEHNSWDNVRIRRGWIVLRCRVCEGKWRQRPLRSRRCASFTAPRGCPNGSACELLHVHLTKRTQQQRMAARQGDLALRGPPCQIKLGGDPASDESHGVSD
eukprot:TRINITY_DN275_c5_g1_i1.p1 TRINITY_DN275_c5_g1~~TRINITY_DN275_c5_g1_i1.p1  ORF type:complete len:533 (+),score=168.15 TRINITY_DN275_c5_g1_i1:85-1599(+)